MSRRVTIYSIVSFVWYVTKDGNLLDYFICLIYQEGWQSTRLFHLLDMSRRVSIYSIVSFVWYVSKGGNLLDCFICLMSRRVAIYSIVLFAWYVTKGGNLLDCFICLICHERWQSTRLFHLFDRDISNKWNNQVDCHPSWHIKQMKQSSRLPPFVTYQTNETIE
jgi:hypothetical protein